MRTVRRGVPHVESAAIVQGHAAWVIADVLDRHLRDEPTAGILSHDSVLATFEAIRRAGAAWARRVSSAGQSDTSDADSTASSQATDELTTTEVAEMLQLHPRTVRRHAERGHLAARRAGGMWLFDRGDVLAALARDQEAA